VLLQVKLIVFTYAPYVPDTPVILDPAGHVKVAVEQHPEPDAPPTRIPDDALFGYEYGVTPPK